MMLKNNKDNEEKDKLESEFSFSFLLFLKLFFKLNEI